MSLHESIRDMVSARGRGVVEDRSEFRAALDDFLTEDEITVGELNLLSDAVGLGAVDRLLELLDNGAEPAVAAQEAGLSLARDRGTDDVRRATWAVSVIGYALGRVPQSLLPIAPGEAESASTTRVSPHEAETLPQPHQLLHRAPVSFGAAVEHTGRQQAADPTSTPSQRGRQERRWPSIALAVIVLSFVTGGSAALLLKESDDDAAPGAAASTAPGRGASGPATTSDTSGFDGSSDRSRDTSPAGTGSIETTTKAAVPTEIPNDFPIDLDQSAYDYVRGQRVDPEPTTAIEGVGTFSACGFPIEPRYQDHLVSEAVGTEYADLREVLLFSDAETAVDYLSAVRDLLRNCTEELVDGQWSRHWTVSEYTMGFDDLFVSDVTDGSTGVNEYGFVRVGSAVVVRVVSGEFGSAAPSNRLAELHEPINRVAQAMCVFTEAGC